MSEMMRMDAFSDDLLGDQKMSDSKKSQSPEHYITLEPGTATKFAEAMKEAYSAEKDVQITVELKNNHSQWKHSSWKAICDVYIKEIFGVDPAVVLKRGQSTMNLSRFWSSFPAFVYKELNIQPYFKVKYYKAKEDTVICQITFSGSDKYCALYYEHLYYCGKNIKNLKQSTNGLQGEKLALGVAKWLRERTVCVPSETSKPYDDCAMIFAKALYDKVAKCEPETLVVAYREFTEIVGFKKTAPVPQKSSYYERWHMTNGVKINGIPYFFDITCENDSELKLWTTEELGKNYVYDPILDRYI